MAFAVSDYHDLVRLLEEHPEWRQELRRLILADDILELPRLVRELAEAQKRTEARVEELIAAQARTEARVEELAEAQKRTEAKIQTLIDEVGELKGWQLEHRYQQRLPSYLGRSMRRVRVISWERAADLFHEARDREELTEDELIQLLAMDYLARARPRFGDNPDPRHLAIEVSWVVDEGDVERAHERAELLKRIGLAPAVGVVGGNSSTEQALERAIELGVGVVLAGHVLSWPGNP